VKKRVSLGKKILIIVAVVLTVVLSAAIFIGKASFDGAFEPDSEIDFSKIIVQNVALDTKIVDIAMLGAHDAFTHGISAKSKGDPQDTSAFLKKGALAFASGFTSRYAKAQISDASGLLRRGVRYFDVRITVKDGVFYTMHGLISTRLDFYLTQLIDFLSENIGEVIIFSIQHAHLGGKMYSELFDYIGAVKSNGLSLFDFVNSFAPLYRLTLGDATRQGLSGGAVIIADAPTYKGCYHYSYTDAVRSNWHDKFKTKDILPCIDAEYSTLKNDGELDRDKFRVNQAQLTFNAKEIFGAVFKWSLLDLAKKHNADIVDHESFDAWLSVMPVFLVDYCDSTYGDFNRKVVERINNFNKGALR